MADITTASQFRMRRLIRGWKREMEEKREAVTGKPVTEQHQGLVSDNIRISSIRPWQPSDDEPDGGSAA